MKPKTTDALLEWKDLSTSGQKLEILFVEANICSGLAKVITSIYHALLSECPSG
jgi:hypothetical protein